MKKILTTTDVAEMFGVGRKTVARWADAGRLPGFRTPGGHRRFRASQIRPLVSTGPWEGVEQPTLEEATDAQGQ